jgi:hypothetical protein
MLFLRKYTNFFYILQIFIDMKKIIKKLLREGLEELTPEDLEQINQIVNRELIQAKEQQEKLKDELETTRKVLDSILTAMASGKLEGVPTDYVLNLKKDKENRIHQLEKYIKNWGNVDREEIFNRLKTQYLANKKYEEEKLKARESRTFGKEDIVNLFVDALEGGSNYWYHIRHLPNEVRYKAKEMGQSVSEAIGEYILKGGYVQFYDAEEEYDEDDYTETHSDNGLLGTVDMDSILEAITIIKRDYPDVWENILDEQYDANDADIFLQLCVMGDVVFG